jgi:hypothetical protein
MKKILFASVFFAAVSSLSAQMVEVTSTGLGLGTSTPGYLLDVEGGSAVFNGTHGSVYTSADQSPFLGTGVLLQGKSGTPSVVAQTGTATSGSAFAVYNSTPAALLWVGGDGNVAVGATTAGKKLEVAGEIVARASASSNTPAGCLQAGSDGLIFWVNASYDPANAGSGWGRMMTLAHSGNVGIGVTSPSYKLEVNGSVRATSFVSNSTTYADFVFKPGYKLRSLPEVEAAIQRDGHLPDIPSEAEAKVRGIDLAAQQVKLLQKVEELTLYMIDLQKSNTGLRAEVEQLKSRIGTTQP